MRQNNDKHLLQLKNSARKTVRYKTIIGCRNPDCWIEDPDDDAKRIKFRWPDYPYDLAEDNPKCCKNCYADLWLHGESKALFSLPWQWSRKTMGLTSNEPRLRFETTKREYEKYGAWFNRDRYFFPKCLKCGWTINKCKCAIHNREGFPSFNEKGQRLTSKIVPYYTGGADTIKIIGCSECDAIVKPPIPYDANRCHAKLKTCDPWSYCQKCGAALVEAGKKKVIFLPPRKPPKKIKGYEIVDDLCDICPRCGRPKVLCKKAGSCICSGFKVSLDYGVLLLPPSLVDIYWKAFDDYRVQNYYLNTKARRKAEKDTSGRMKTLLAEMSGTIPEPVYNVVPLEPGDPALDSPRPHRDAEIKPMMEKDEERLLRKINALNFRLKLLRKHNQNLKRPQDIRATTHRLEYKIMELEAQRRDLKRKNPNGCYKPGNDPGRIENGLKVYGDDIEKLLPMLDSSENNSAIRSIRREIKLSHRTLKQPGPLARHPRFFELAKDENDLKGMLNRRWSLDLTEPVNGPYIKPELKEIREMRIQVFELNERLKVAFNKQKHVDRRERKLIKEIQTRIDGMINGMNRAYPDIPSMLAPIGMAKTSTLSEVMEYMNRKSRQSVRLKRELKKERPRPKPSIEDQDATIAYYEERRKYLERHAFYDASDDTAEDEIYFRLLKAEILWGSPLGDMVMDEISRRNEAAVKRAKAIDLDAEIGLSGKPKSHPVYRTLVLTGILTGMREGEIFGLTWGCVDFKTNSLKVEKSMYRRQLTEPKTERSIREIQIPKMLTECLREEQIKAFKEGRHGKDSLVFVNSVGHAIDQRGFYREFKAALKRAGIDKQTRFHDLRHAYSSTMIANNEDVTVVSKHLGHSSTKMTLDVYSHCIKNREERQAIAERTADALFSVDRIEIKR